MFCCFCRFVDSIDNHHNLILKWSAEEKKDALKTALEGEDIDDIKAKKEELEKVIQELSAKVYEQAQQAQQQGQEEQGSQDSTVEDADFKEVKDDEDKK